MPNSSIPRSRPWPAAAGGVTPPSLGRALLVAVLAAVAVAWGPAGPASACSCRVATTADRYAEADVVFVGRLVERTVDEPVTSSVDPARHVFAVDRAVKGQVPERAVVLSAVSGASCGLELRGTGPFVVFAGEAGTHLEAGLCGGTAELTPELEAQMAALTDEAAPPVDVVPSNRRGPDGNGWWPAPAVAAAGVALLIGVPVGLRLLLRRR